MLEAEGISHVPRRDEKLTVTEAVARKLLARVEKSWGDHWEMRNKAIPIADVCFDELPEWLTRSGDAFVVDCGKYEFPNRDGARWVHRLIWAEFAAGSGNDFVAAINAYRAYKAEERRLADLAHEERSRIKALKKAANENGDRRNAKGGKSDKGGKGQGASNVPKPKYTDRQCEELLWDWCRMHGVNGKRIEIAERIIAQIRDEIAASPLRLENGIATQHEFSAEALTKAICAGLIDNLSRPNDSGNYEGRIGEFELGNMSSCPKADLIVVGGVRKIAVTGRRGRTGHIQLADMAAPVQAEWLAEIMPQLCTEQRFADHAYDPAADEVRERVDSQFDGRAVATRRERSEDAAAAAKTFAEYVAGLARWSTPS